MKFIIYTLLVAIIGTLLIELAIYIFGIVGVWFFCCGIVAFFGLIVVPIKQIKNDSHTKSKY